jgi:hypothetical protein
VRVNNGVRDGHWRQVLHILLILHCNVELHPLATRHLPVSAAASLKVLSKYINLGVHRAAEL